MSVVWEGRSSHEEEHLNCLNVPVTDFTVDENDEGNLEIGQTLGGGLMRMHSNYN
jgi:hypothetical protein